MKKRIIYTRTGDYGTTSLVAGARVPKTHLRLEAYGTADVLYAQIACLISLMDHGTDKSLLHFPQHTSIALASSLASAFSPT